MEVSIACLLYLMVLSVATCALSPKSIKSRSDHLKKVPRKQEIECCSGNQPAESILAAAKTALTEFSRNLKSSLSIESSSPW